MSGRVDSPGDAEFGFELLVCRWAERAWPPDEHVDAQSDDADEPAIVVARQLGTASRRWDTIVIETTTSKLAARRQFGDRELDSDLLHVVRNAPAEWAWYRDALPDPGYPWRYVRQAVHRAAGRDLIETRRNGNRIQLRRIAPYPDWVDRIVAIENKPDLDASAARALRDQLEHDVETALADEVWVATMATGATVEPALLEDIPIEVGVLVMSFDHEGAWPEGYESGDATVSWHPTSLPAGVDTSSDPDAHPGSDPSSDGTARRDRRLEIAERAYGRGWRSYADTMRPDCRHFELRRVGDALVPWCGAKERPQTARECAGSCPSFEPEPPVWRTRGWPIEGGPGKGIKQLLDRRRERARQSNS